MAAGQKPVGSKGQPCLRKKNINDTFEGKLHLKKNTVSLSNDIVKKQKC
jgi:hypothetical protein